MLTFIRKLFSSDVNYPSVIYVTGGGSTLLGWLTSVPGCSNFLLEGGVPYSFESSKALMKKSGCSALPSSFCSMDAAIMLAQSALNRSVELQLQSGLGHVSNSSRGFGLTAALATGQPKRGDHRVYVACADLHGNTKVFTLTLEKGLRDRSEEDQVASALLLDCILDSCSVYPSSTFPASSTLLKETEIPIIKQYPDDREVFPAKALMQEKELLKDALLKLAESASTSSSAAVADSSLSKYGSLSSLPSPPPHFLVCGTTGALVWNPTSAIQHQDTTRRWLVVPGSFNPLHEGHELMARSAFKFRNTLDGVHASGGVDRIEANDSEFDSVVFELSLVNADKGLVADADQLAERLRAFRGIPSPSSLSSSPANKSVMNIYGDRSTGGFASGDHSTNISELQRRRQWSVLATANAPLFVDKARLFGGNVDFVVGFDTYRRLIDPRYAPGKNLYGLSLVLQELRIRKVRVFVVGRVDRGNYISLDFAWSKDGIGSVAEVDAIQELDDGGLLRELHDDVFVSVPDFRVDLSSTEIRMRTIDTASNTVLAEDN